MGRRGPKPKGEYQNRTAVVSTKITPELRAALEAVCAASGRPLSSEIEARLRRSFAEDTKAGLLGGRQLYAMLRMIAATMGMVGPQAYFLHHRKPAEETDWLLDPIAYDQAFQAVVQILEGLRPPGDTKPRKMKGVDSDSGRVAKTVNWLRSNIGAGLARTMLDQVADAKPGQPLPNEDTRQLRLARRIADDLGPLTKPLAERRGQTSKKEGQK